MKKIRLIFSLSLLFLILSSSNVFAQSTADVLCLFNLQTEDYLFTTDRNEYNQLVRSIWWQDIHQGRWTTSMDQGIPVYRLYCMVNHKHLYTSDMNEINYLLSTGGWSMDQNWQPMFYSYGQWPVFRLYNPEHQAHFLTVSTWDYNSYFPKYGWNQEGIKFYAVARPPGLVN